MGKMIKADFGRIICRIPRLLLCLCMLVLEGLVLLLAVKLHGNDANLLKFGKIYLKTAAMFFGLIELAFIYGDDLKSKVLQTGVAYGGSRKNIVLGKWIELLIFLVIDMAFMVLVGCGIGAIFHIKTATYLVAFVKSAVKIWIMTVTYMTMSTIFVFALQNTSVSILVFVLLSFGVMQSAINFVTNHIKAIQWLHLEQLTVSYFMNHFGSNLILHSMGIIIYVIVFLLLTMVVYGRREFDI